MRLLQDCDSFRVEARADCRLKTSNRPAPKLSAALASNCSLAIIAANSGRLRPTFSVVIPYCQAWVWPGFKRVYETALSMSMGHSGGHRLHQALNCDRGWLLRTLRSVDQRAAEHFSPKRGVCGEAKWTQQTSLLGWRQARKTSRTRSSALRRKPLGSKGCCSCSPCFQPRWFTKHAITGLTKSTSLDGRAYGIACGQIDIGNAATDMTGPMASGVRQADGSIKPEPRMDAQVVADAVVFMAGLPLDANVQFMTVMATKMPFIGRG